MNGVLVALEGIDGSGKTTTLHLVAQHLENRGWSHIITREPTDSSPYGQTLRATKDYRMSVLEEYSLFCLDRADHARSTILPGLRDDKIVLTDRYLFSSAAYQGVRFANGSKFEHVQRIIKESQEIAPMPDLLVLFLIPADIAYARLRHSRTHLDAFETLESLRKHAAAFQYISCIAQCPTLIVRPDLHPPSFIATQVLQAIVAQKEKNSL